VIAVELYQGDGGEWDRFVQSAPGWTHFHRYGWRKVFERVFDHECTYLAARDPAGRIVGVLPLVRVNSRMFGDYLVSLPFLNYGGPLGHSDACQQLAIHASDVAQDRGVDLLELRSRYDLGLDLPVSHRKITVLRDLTPTGGKPWSSDLSSKLRSQIKRPQKEGVEIRFGLEQLESFYQVFARHMRDLGTPVQSIRLFQAIRDVFPDDVWFGCAYLREEPVAAGCGFRWGTEFEMTWASSLRRYNGIAPNMLLYWSFMERCVEQGVTLFNFGRCTPGGGTHRFKQQWGSRDVPLWWYYQSDGERAATPSTDEKAFAWGPVIWRRLPLPLANTLGPYVVRYVP